MESKKEGTVIEKFDSSNIHGNLDKLQKLGALISDPQHGFKVENRKFHGTTWKSVFLGNEAVTWLTDHTTAKTREEAIQIGNDLLQIGLFSHVTYEHELMDKDYFYRFNDFEASSEGGEQPPGSFGIPVLGETLAISEDIPGFFVSHSLKYQGFFKTHFFFNKVVCFGDPEGIELANDEKTVVRKDAFPPHWMNLFCKGDRNQMTVNMLDGEHHLKRKAQLLSAFTDEAMASYLPVLEDILKRHLEDWSKTKTFKWTDKLKLLCFEESFKILLGIDGTPSLSKSFDKFTSGFASLPVNLPGSMLSKAYKGRDSILKVIQETIAQRKQEKNKGPDALTHLLEEQQKDNELNDTVLSYECLHFTLASMSPMFTLHTFLLVELSHRPEIFEQMKKEVQEHCPQGALTLDILQKLTYINQVVKETKRLYGGNAVPIQAAKVACPFDFRGRHVPNGWQVIECLGATCQSPKVYTDPEKFDPDRFSEQRHEDQRHKCAFVPQGIVPPQKTHGCAGWQFSTILLQAFIVHLIRGGYTWKLAEKQRLEINAASLPSLPKDGVLVESFGPK